MNWELIGGAIMALLTGAGGWVMGKGKREVASAESIAERDVVNLLRQEVERLSARLSAMESREGRMIRHIYRLEAVIRQMGGEPPQFLIDDAREDSAP